MCRWKEQKFWSEKKSIKQIIILKKHSGKHYKYGNKSFKRIKRTTVTIVMF